MRSPRFWSPKKRSTAIVLRKEGYTYEEIAAKIGGGVGKSAVRKVCMKFLKHNTIADLPRCHKKRITSRRDDSVIIRKALQNRRRSSKDISADMAEIGVTVSARTVRRRLFKAGLKARIPRKKPYLNAAQRKKRVDWCKDHKNWTVDDWSKVLFSDESRISIFGSDGVRYVRRRVHEECLPECMLPTMKHPVAVMIWACISAKGVGRMKVINGIMNARVYVDEILTRKVCQSATDLFGQDEDFIFQQDGAPCHTAKVCQAWFKDNRVKLLEWPGNSPDLNPIENLWARLKRLVSARRPSNKTELIEAIVQCWHHVITVQELQQLVNSMPRRCKAVIDAKGYATKY